jgi:hypothetical protein
MEPIIEIEYDEKILEVLGKYKLASIEVGEFVYVWLAGEEWRDMANKVADGDMPIEEAMKAVEYKFSLDPKIWVKIVDKEADATLYILMPKFPGVFAEHLQLYLSSICKCGCPIGVGVICNAPEPWNCMHSTVIVCAKCGEEIAKISAVHGGGWGKVVSLKDFEALREMVVEPEGDEE